MLESLFENVKIAIQDTLNLLTHSIEVILDLDLPA
jgi:hypothetical protein